MILDIKPIDRKGYAYVCWENAVITVAEGLKKGYDMSYSEAWGFPYVNNGESFGQRFTDGIGDKLPLFEKYHGLKVNITPVTTGEDALDLIRNGLGSKMPSVVGFDTFWLPWNLKFYQKLHDSMGGHAIIIKGINEEEKVLYCVDPLYDIETCTLSFDHFIQGVIAMILNFDEVDFVSDYDYKNIVKSAAERVINNNIFDQMRAFSADIVTSLDLHSEIEGRDIIPEAPFFINLKFISQARRRFASTLRYLYNKFRAGELMYYTEMFMEAYFKWESVYSKLVKASTHENTSDAVNKASKMILEIAQFEQTIADEMLDIGNSTSFQLYLNRKNTAIDDEDTVSNTNLVCLDLSKYFNNKGASMSVDSRADLTEYIRESVLLDESLVNTEWNVEGMVFKFPPVNEEINDNISCSGECIDVPNNIYNEVLFLGCSEWGSYQSEFLINFTDGEVESAKLGLTEWDSGKAHFGEVLALAGTHVFKGNITNSKVNIFATRVKIRNRKAVSSICLPDCPNIHVFAISLR